MNIEEFNVLPIEEQVKYINIQLEHMSLNKACSVLGVSESTVRDRFKRNNYKREGKKFISLETTTNTDTTTSNVAPIENKLKPIKKAEKKDNNLDSIKLLEAKIKALESQIEATNKRIDSLETTKTTINTTTDTTINTYEGNEVIRSFRVNEGVQQRFKNYCKANAEHKVSDILSTILDEYLKSQVY
ncbi:DUF5320 domain-containing protein [Clostridioides difficile]|uniref:DUF5320 domain-containing protein n=1 Tax=Clostridioides difficile TaxID=1496 RepID=UPI001033DE5A|nr:DUF5320 domain-containing protein [Clostridioides difficile]